MAGHYHDAAGRYDFCDDTRCPRSDMFGNDAITNADVQTMLNSDTSRRDLPCRDCGHNPCVYPCARRPVKPDMRNYRMTHDEFERFVTEYDPLADDGSLPNVVRNVVRLVHANPGHRINLGYGGVTLDFDGFYWVRTSRPVNWM